MQLSYFGPVQKETLDEDETLHELRCHLVFAGSVESEDPNYAELLSTGAFEARKRAC